MSENPLPPLEGILLIDKPLGKTAFSLIAALRKRIGVRTIGHAGTLDPLATGVMILLIGKKFTKQSNRFLGQEKEYRAVLHLGIATDTYDSEGKITEESSFIPSLAEITLLLERFQGEVEQIPPMFSAKKVKGKKLYELARKGQTIERAPSRVTLATQFISYDYPFLTLHVTCSKGTYIRSLAHDLGHALGCKAHLSSLVRVRSGTFQLKDCIDGTLLESPQFDQTTFLKALYPL